MNGKGEMQIEKNIPFPDSSEDGRYKTKYPWPDMAVGDSIIYDGPIASARSVASYWSAKTLRKKQFRARKINEIARIWRVK